MSPVRIWFQLTPKLVECIGDVAQFMKMRRGDLYQVDGRFDECHHIIHFSRGFCPPTPYFQSEILAVFVVWIELQSAFNNLNCSVLLVTANQKPCQTRTICGVTVSDLRFQHFCKALRITLSRFGVKVVAYGVECVDGGADHPKVGIRQLRNLDLRIYEPRPIALLSVDQSDSIPRGSLVDTWRTGFQVSRQRFNHPGRRFRIGGFPPEVGDH